MRKPIALTFMAGTLFLAGCCTSHHAKVWDYHVVSGNPRSPAFEANLKQAGADGFAIVSTQTLPADSQNTPITIVVLKKIKQ
jgi:hypothetical protein